MQNRKNRRRKAAASAVTMVMLAVPTGSAFAQTPSPSTSATPSQTASAEATPSETLATPSVSASVTPSETPSASPTATQTSATPSVSASVTPSETPSASASPTVTPAVTETSVAAATGTPTGAPTPTPTATAAPQLAPAAVGDPLAGLPVTLSAGGNTVTLKLTTVADGSGWGTTNQCFINTKNGYALGDDNATDGYVCTRDTVTYRVDWNAIITDTTANNKLSFLFGNTDDASKFQVANNNGNWKFIGVTGGAGLGFSGSSTDDGHAQMTFDATGARSGTWTFSISTDGKPDANLSVMQMAAKLALGGQTATMVTDRDVTLRNAPRLDVVSVPIPADGGLTKIDGVSYRGITAQDNLTLYTDGVRYQTSETGYPGFDRTKGVYTWGGPDGGSYWFNTSWVDSRYAGSETGPFRFSMLNAPAGTMVQVDGKAPVPATFDGTTAFIDAPWSSRVKFLLPWDALPVGTQTYTTRIDPTTMVFDDANQPSFNGVAMDPGVGLACDVTTKDVLPGTVAGSNQPNNNCTVTTFEKRTGTLAGLVKFDGQKQAWDISSRKIPDLKLSDGTTVVNPVVAAAKPSGALTYEDRTTFYNSYIDVTPSGSDKDLAVCSVWDPDQQRLASSNPVTGYAWPRQLITQKYPGAVVYYTSKDLRPAGAPIGAEETPNCGSPSDTSTWTKTVPKDLSTVGGIMVVFPGDSVMIEPINVQIQMQSEYQGLFQNLVNDNVRNYAGITSDSTVPAPSYSGDSDAVSVIKSGVRPWTGYETNSNIGIGPVTYTSTVKARPEVWGAVPAGDTITERIYLDKCMLNVNYNNDPGSYAGMFDLQSSKLVGSPSPESGCGKSTDFYVENTYKFGPSYGTGYNLTAVPTTNITWTAPITSKAGDKYYLHTVWSQPDGTAYLITGSGDASSPDKVYTVQPSAVVGSAKTSNDPLVEINQPYSDTIGWFNYSPASAGSTTFIDVLPYNGDARGSKFSGTNALAKVEYVGSQPNASTFVYTKADPKTVSSNPSDASNQAGGSTVWCTDLSGGDCPSSLAEVTALKFTTADFAVGMTQFFRLSFAPKNNLEGDVYFNQLAAGVASKLQLPVPASQIVKTEVVMSSISGYVFGDLDRSSSWQKPGEPHLPGFTVELLDASGAVVATTTTNADGWYIFDALVSGKYQVRWKPLDPAAIFTVAGSDKADAALDGLTEVIKVPFNDDVTEVNAGVWQPKPVTVRKLGTACDVGEDTCALAGSSFTLFSGDPAQAGSTFEVLTPSADGTAFASKPLQPGEYWLVETKAPVGHVLLAEPVRFTVSATGLALVAGGSDQVGISADDPYTLDVVDQLAGSMPDSGGRGPWDLLPLSLVAAVGALFGIRRHRLTD